MGFTPVDPAAWERAEFLSLFGHTAVYMTVELDITGLLARLRRRELRLYPALVYCAANVINRFPEFRYGRNSRGENGQWDVVHPFYTVPRADNPALFSMKYTPYVPDFAAFYRAFADDCQAARTCGRLVADENLPENICGISAVPGTSFTSFSFGGDPKTDFIPFVLYGRYRQEGERVRLPVAGEFSHAVNDGFHISRFFRELEETADTLLDGE